MPCAVNETAVTTTGSSERHHPDAPPDIIAEEPKWAWRAPEQLTSDSKSPCHENRTEFEAANPVAILAQLSASIGEINQPISAVVMNAEAALWLLLAEPTDTEAVRRLLDCIVRDGMRTGDIVSRTRALIKKAPPADTVHRELVLVGASRACVICGEIAAVHEFLIGTKAKRRPRRAMSELGGKRKISARDEYFAF